MSEYPPASHKTKTGGSIIVGPDRIRSRFAVRVPPPQNQRGGFNRWARSLSFELRRPAQHFTSLMMTPKSASGDRGPSPASPTTPHGLPDQVGLGPVPACLQQNPNGGIQSLSGRIDFVRAFALRVLSRTRRRRTRRFVSLFKRRQEECQRKWGGSAPRPRERAPPAAAVVSPVVSNVPIESCFPFPSWSKIATCNLRSRSPSHSALTSIVAGPHLGSRLFFSRQQRARGGGPRFARG